MCMRMAMFMIVTTTVCMLMSMVMIMMIMMIMMFSMMIATVSGVLNQSGDKQLYYFRRISGAASYYFYTF